jgi:hypothetical protein
MDNNFAGMNGFIWWVGVVENRYDPLKLGRLRVRIVGWHNEDKNELQSEHLPWADALTPLTHTNASLDIKEGDWVIGFFTDGNNAQKPVVFGHLNGIKTSEFNTNEGFSPQLTDAQKAIQPKAADAIVMEKLDEPTTPRTARGVVEGTPVGVANENRAHVCDIRDEMKKAAALARLKFSQLVQAIRAAVRAILDALGNSPDGVVARFIEIAKGLLRDLKFIQSIIEEIRDWTNVIVGFARKVRAMIDWILTLPKKLLAFLKDCLAELYASLKGGISELFSLSGGVGDNTDSGISEAMGVFGEIVDTAKATVQAGIEVVQAPAAIVAAFTSPASAADITKAGDLVTGYLSATALNNASSNTVTNIQNSSSNFQMA